MRNFLVVALLVLGCSSSALALDGKKAMHVGGTMVAQVPEKTEGVFATSNEEMLVFRADDRRGALEIPYKGISTIEYGQKASHRLKTAILLSPVALFSKKRRHYVSLTYQDRAGKDQAVVFEIGKDSLRQTVLVIEARSGKKVAFQDDDARKHFGK
jgi:hypothetical protein